MQYFSLLLDIFMAFTLNKAATRMGSGLFWSVFSYKVESSTPEKVFPSNPPAHLTKLQTLLENPQFRQISPGQRYWKYLDLPGQGPASAPLTA